MKTFPLLRLLCAATPLLLIWVPACDKPSAKDPLASDSVWQNNPLLKKWEGEFSGVPPFANVQVAWFKPAMEAAIARNLTEVESVAGNREAATFQNTIEALEKTGQDLARVGTVYGIWSTSMSDSAFQAVEQDIEPQLAAMYDKIVQNEKLFRRIEAVYQSPAKEKLTPEQQRLVWVHYNNFVRAGAKLDAAKKKEIADINQNLAELYTKFSQNLLADESEQALVLEKDEDVKGLPQSLRDAAAATAAKKGKGRYVITNTRSAVEPFLTYADDRALREKAWRMFVNRGDNGNEHDNNAIITDILQLRARRAELLGYKTHAHWRLENTMAKTPERALELLERVWVPAIARVREEVADMQALADKQKAGIKIEPWDYRYYMEKVRMARYNLDVNEVKQYMQLDKLREAMFWVAGELFDFDFKEVTTVPVYHPDVRVWEMTSKTTGEHVGLFYFDPYAREGKRSGAWMNSYRDQQLLAKTTPIVSNNLNLIKGKEGEPDLITWDEAVTLFHEFGHGLHGLCSRVTYPSLAGTSVVRDYVEFPSQLLEHWVGTPEVLQKYAVHYKTGKPIPLALVDKIKKAATFNQGFSTTEYLASALVDMKLHLAGNVKIDADAFEKETLTQMGMPSEIVMRHRTPQFGHIFSGDGYSAGYYSYLWADVLTADGFNAFAEAGGPYDKAMAQKLMAYVLSVGNSIDPEQGYLNFRGRSPEIDALMKKRGFPLTTTKR